jgi:hypothetical protein
MKRPDPRQSANSPLRLGGAELFLVFLEQAIRHGVRRLEVITPYIDDAAFADNSVKHAWDCVVTSADTTVVVRDPASAAAVCRAIPPSANRSRILLHDRLHMKLFIARCSDARFALAGSLNLTGAALHHNEELGLLVRSCVSPTQHEAMTHLCAIAAAIQVDGRPFRPDGGTSRPVTSGKSALGRRSPDLGLMRKIRQVPVQTDNFSIGTNDALVSTGALNVFEDMQ